MCQFYPIAAGHCMIASEISVCLDQGNSLKAVRLSSRDRGKLRDFGGRRGTKAWEFSRLSDSPLSESSFWLCVQEFCLVDISIYSTSIWFGCVKAMTLRKHEIRKTASDKHFRLETLKELCSRHAWGIPGGNAQKCYSQTESEGKPTKFNLGCLYEWSQEDIYSNKGCLVAAIPQGNWLPWVSVYSLNTSPFLCNLWIFSPNVKFVSFIVLTVISKRGVFSLSKSNLSNFSFIVNVLVLPHM